MTQQPEGSVTFKKQLSRKEVQRFRSMFAHWDDNGDGAISYPEFVAVMKVATSGLGLGIG